jgi:hypothetical protein
MAFDWPGAKKHPVTDIARAESRKTQDIAPATFVHLTACLFLAMGAKSE